MIQGLHQAILVADSKLLVEFREMIPREMAHIWIGPEPMPDLWMRSWKDAHPDWNYRIYDNDYLCGRRFRNQAQINAYFRRNQYAGVADLMRYEILYEEGGFIAEADSICLHPIDELMTDERAYTVYEFPEGRRGYMSPFLASNPGNLVIRHVIESLSSLDPEKVRIPWKETGNGFLSRFFRLNPELKSKVTIFPSHYFLPEHYSGEYYSGSDTIYSKHLWGGTKGRYAEGRSQTSPSVDRIGPIRRRIRRELQKNLEGDKV